MSKTKVEKEHIAFSGGQSRSMFKIQNHVIVQRGMMDLMKECGFPFVNHKSNKDTTLILIPDDVIEPSNSSIRRAKKGVKVQHISAFMKENKLESNILKILNDKFNYYSTRRPKPQNQNQHTNHNNNNNTPSSASMKYHSDSDYDNKDTNANIENTNKQKNKCKVHKVGKEEEEEEEKEEEEKEKENENEKDENNKKKAHGVGIDKTKTHACIRRQKETETFLNTESGLLWIGDPMFFIRESSDIVKRWNHSWVQFTKDVNNITDHKQYVAEFFHLDGETPGMGLVAKIPQSTLKKLGKTKENRNSYQIPVHVTCNESYHPLNIQIKF